ncbi:MAG: phosphoribosylanthranilate isomerase [Chryseobacterium sp.]|uniref:phosphoribosylanthranilate isomerase n=1 Tax=Chryseobacterium sp. TaxID=1871047 RepID=UPI0025BC3969|nr:phosphoribosylanthranilate isomerase [Chryseobacterium sp.]MCJ7935453.1 phosphoribosylanthranilate isomerase [Chryseobacterium sp.]
MNLHPKLKVCGLTRSEQILELMAMKVDLLGFIFYEKSPRYVLNHLSLDEIYNINHPGKVGVFVNEKVDQIVKTADKSGLNYIQLHGDEDEDFIDELRKELNPEIKIIKVIRIGENTAENRNTMALTLSSPLSAINYLLFDTDSKAFGGTGKQFDWKLLNECKIPLPYFLSGGISEDNIDHMKSLQLIPFAVDINSKFEIEPGNKDVNKIKKFKSILESQQDVLP